MQVKGSNILITGAASGLGASTASYLSEKGANLILLDRDEGALANVADNLNATWYATDVTDEDRIADILSELSSKNSIPNVCINCAGVVLAQKMHSSKGKMGVSGFKKVIDINLIGTFNVMQACIEHMLELDARGADGERGLIINTSSIAAFEGQMGQTAYSASKGAVAAMTIPAARELAIKGIRVNAIAPGLMDTPMLASLPEAARQSLIDSTLFPKRLGTGEDFAVTVEHIIENTFINGEVIRLDGAIRLTAK